MSTAPARRSSKSLGEHADRHPYREVFSDDKERITYYGELKDKVERCAEFLRRIGIGRNDVVTVQLPNRIAFPIVFVALDLIGAIANKVNPDFRARELVYILKFSGSRGLSARASSKGSTTSPWRSRCSSRCPPSPTSSFAGEAGDGVHDLDRGLRETAPARNLPVALHC
ncbi:MAG: AMP-binding protein [Rhodoplanes sp.]